MKAIIVYTSSTGFTKQYAEWISEETGIDAVTLEDGMKRNLSEYDTIVYGGWIHASMIAKINKIVKLVPKEKLILFTVGAAPINDETLKNVANGLPAELKGMEFTYCPGGLRYEKMKSGSRLMMRMFAKMLKGKKDKSKADEEMANLIQSSYDGSDRKYVTSLIQKLKDMQ